MNIENFSNIKTEQIGADLSRVVDRIVRQYESFYVAFQKEAIQNSWDVRNDRKEGINWNFKIYSIKDNDKTHLVIEDFETKGMNNKRWEAFQSLWKPEKDNVDAGGQGQGKFVLMGASVDHILIVESISNETPYKCKFLHNEKKSSDNDQYSIEDFISSATPLNHEGTKIWVYNVDKNFLDTVKSKNFYESIIESWWQILGDRFNAAIQIFDKKISFPELPQSNEENILLENKPVGNSGRIKRLVLNFYEKPIPEIFQGIRVQRANMMITKIPFEIRDKDYQGRFSGYVEFEESLEERLKSIERTDHCGFLYEDPWKSIKALVKEEAEEFVSRIIPSKEQRKNINLKNLSEIVSRANQIINEHCSEIFGSGTVVPPIPPRPKPPLRIKYLVINKREVKFNDIIKPSCGIMNGLGEDKKISLHLELKRLGVKILGEEYKLKIETGKQKTIKLLEIKLDESKFLKGKYTLRITLTENRHDIDTKSTSFYLETKRESIKRGFIKTLGFYDSEEPTRNKPVKNGIIEINLEHKDFKNIYNLFEDKTNLLNKQMGFYFIKICLDEAMNELFKVKYKDKQKDDIDDMVMELRDTKDKMYYEIYE